MRARRTIASEGVLEEGNNAFGLLRVVLAGMVIVSHSWSLGAYGKEPLVVLSGGTTLGYLAVAGFFALSGALVAQSAERTTPGRFLWQRSRRIFPGYWACLLVTAFVLAPLIATLQHLPAARALATPNNVSAHTYVVNNFPLRLDQQTIGYVLAKLPYPHSINGSLWSLPYEFLCYLLVLMLVRAWLLTERRALVLGAALVVSATLAVLASAPSHEFGLFVVAAFGALEPKHLGFLWAIFLVAGTLALLRERVPFSPLWVALVSALFLASLPLGLFKPYGGLLFPYVILGLGRYLPRPLRAVGRKADFSYGLYLYGFPVGQALVASGKLHSGPALAACSLLLTLPCAVASWFLVERWFLRARKVPSAST
jgi:peptidoglycan/LPS O-acetylase OafA/YrhL